MTRLRTRQDSGFAMIEAIVAATLMVVVALGVLRGLDSAQRSSGREKARSAAAALTEQDQERLRSFRAVDLANYDQTREVTVNKVKYTITSQVDWVRDSTGGTESCNSNTVQADYMRITSVTKSSLINTPIPPIKMSSLVAPPIGAFGDDQGTLGIQVNDRNGVGIPGVNVSIAGPAAVSNPTNSAGCAIFAYVPIGAYTATVNTAGWVDTAGRQNATASATVTQGTVKVASITYDRAASVVATFDTEARDGSTPLVRPALATQLSARNSAVPPVTGISFTGMRYFDPPPVGGMLPTITATNLFPFVDGYGMYGGGCPGANPTINDSDYYTTFPDQYLSVVPGQAATPVVVRMPSINLRVLYNGSATTMAPYYPTTRIMVKSTSTNCSELFDFPAPATEATLTGFMANSALPFGTYTVCVQSRSPGSTSSTRWKELTGVKNWYYKGMKSPDVASPVVDMFSGTNGSYQGGCG